MKRLHINEMETGKTYYELCCGQVSEFILLEKRGAKVLVYYPNVDLDIEIFLDDSGIDHSKVEYVNNLNFTFTNKSDAEQLSKTKEYQSALAKHDEHCEQMDNIIGSYNDYDDHYDSYIDNED